MGFGDWVGWGKDKGKGNGGSRPPKQPPKNTKPQKSQSPKRRPGKGS